MQFNFTHNDKTYSYNSTVFFDLSTPIRNGEENVNAYFLNPPKFEPFRAGGFVGSVALGGACNCEDIYFNAHGNGTHTECVGHISKETYTINQCLNQYMSVARLITVQPERLDSGDSIIPASVLDGVDLSESESIIIRSVPNGSDKLLKKYSGTNPTYLDASLTRRLANSGIKHLIIDLPSVDREEDGGKLLAHHAFWQYPENPRINATITELAYVPNDVLDGLYLLNLQIAAFESDASPSKPIIYPLTTA
ncbi:MAG: cyclase family protein [Bacteroidia bacterium]|nr:cyclase family protein [Bacteroidia bacterium]